MTLWERLFTLPVVRDQLERVRFEIYRRKADELSSLLQR